MALIPCPECRAEVSSSAPACPRCGFVFQAHQAEPQYERFRKRTITGSFIICLFGLPIGLMLGIPYVWGLSIVGIIVCGRSLMVLRQSP